jgi:hypothetical protein
VTPTPRWWPRSLILSEIDELYQASLEPYRMEAPATVGETAA